MYTPQRTNSISAPGNSLDHSPIHSPHAAIAVLPGLISGEAKVNKEVGRHAIPPEHLTKFAQYAVDHDLVLVVRASTPGSDRYKLAGHATKPLAIKAKTCDFGIAKARVCRDPALSKIRGKPDQIAIVEANIQNLLQDPGSGIVSSQLLLTTEDILRLTAQNEISFQGQAGKGDLKIKSRNANKVQTNYTAQLQNGLYQIADSNGEPLEVLAVTTDDQQPASFQTRMLAQMTSDYDLALIAPAFARRDSSHNVRISATQQSYLNELRPSETPEPMSSSPDEAAPTPGLFANFQGFSSAPPEPGNVRKLATRYETVPPFGTAASGAGSFDADSNIFQRRSSLADATPFRKQSVVSSRGGRQFQPDRQNSGYGAVSEADKRVIDDLNNIMRAGVGEGVPGPNMFHHGPANNVRSSDEDYKDCVIFFPKTFDDGEKIHLADDRQALDSALQVARRHGYPCLFERRDQTPYGSRRPSLAPRGSIGFA